MNGGVDTVLIASASTADARIAARVLSERGTSALVCRDVEDLCGRIDDATGAAVITQDVLTTRSIALLGERLGARPAGSDLPLILVMSPKGSPTPMPRILDQLRTSTHVSALRRPLHPATLVSSVHAALEARRRQRRLQAEVRMRQQRESELEQSRNALLELAETLERRVHTRTALAEERARGMRRLAGQLGLAERRERRRLAGILHDGLQQLLLGAQMQIRRIEAEAPPELHERIQRAESILVEGIEQARNLSHELRPPAFEECDIRRGFEWICEWYRDHHDLDVRLDADGTLPTLDEQAREFLLKASRELLTNVVKHSGSMRAEVVLRSSEEEMTVAIRDGGTQFDREAVVRSMTAREGFGLGHLRDQITALGGRMAVTRAKGGGGCFRLHLPLTTDQPHADEAPWPEDRRPVRVVVVDDHDMVRESLAHALDEDEGIEVVGRAADGSHALELVARERPDVVVMDVQMPGMDGVAATREIVAHWPRVRVVGVSASDAPRTADRMQSAGASDFVSKHAPAALLIAAIRDVAALDRSAEQSA